MSLTSLHSLLLARVGIRQQYQEGVHFRLDASIFRQKSSRIYERALDGKQEAQLIALACSPQPEGYARWTLRLLAERMVELKYVESLSHETVRVVLKKISFSLGRRNVG